MAKWGEGDPRWIVEEREDCKNVNNWHWTEKNATQWSQKRIKELVTDVIIENDDIYCNIVEVSKCEGDAVANNRKGKLIFFYEWVVEMKWQGKFKKSSNKTSYEGRAEVTNLSDENTADELDVIITCDSSTNDSHVIKEFMHLTGTRVIKEKLGQYIKELKEGLILPSKTQNSNDSSKQVGAKNKIASRHQDHQPEKLTSPVSKPLSKKPIELSEEFFCAPEDLFRVLTQEELVSAFTRSNASVNPEVGGKFSLWGGNVTGKFTQLIPAKLLVMDWRRSNWAPDFTSKVRIDLESIDRGTRLKLTQTGVIESEMENIRNGWYQNYFRAIKQIFGYGGGIF